MFGVSKDIWNKYTKKEKVYVVCKKVHILKIAQFVNRKILGNTPAALPEEKIFIGEQQGECIADHWTRIENIFNEAKEQFYADIPGHKRKIVFSGHILEFDRGTCSYINDLASKLDDTEILLLSHATKQGFAKTNSLINCKYFSLPFTFGINRYERGISVTVPEEVENKIKEKEYLAIMEERIRLRHKDMGEGYPVALTYFLYDYYCDFLDYYQPDAVILWCEFYCGHSILKNICEERGIKVLYMEFGALPGTLALECNGQMGESEVAVKWKEFKENPVSREEIMNAKEILEYLKETGLNRRVQVKTNVLDEFGKKYNPDKPIIVMFGQNDYEAGMKPYTEDSQKYHSPIFKGSDDAALFVEKLALKNGWNYIYKPHQMMVRVGECLKDSFSKKTTWVGDSDINELIDIADVVITVVSQCGYVSLIREKPTVMLGYTQMRGKGCAYEVSCKADVEATIREAIKHGYTSKQREAFEKHTAQLLKYYLFDDGLPKKYSIGRTHNEAVKFLDENVKIVKDKEYSERKALFLCENECEVQGAISLKEAFNENVDTDLAVITPMDVSEEKIKEFSTWSAVVIKNYIDELIDEIADKEYTDLYVPGCGESHLLVFNKMNELNSGLKVHIFDGGDIRLYLRDINRDMQSSLLKSFFSCVSEIYLYEKEFMVWKDKADIKIYSMPKSDMRYIQNILKSGKKIYAENWLMKEGYVSNEMDLLEEIGTPEDTTIIPCCAEGIEMFGNEGYSILGKDVADDGSKVLVTSIFNTVYFSLSKYMGYRYVDLANFLSTGNALFASDTYKKFLEICNKEKEKSEGYFCPESQKELQYIIQYLDVE